MVSPSTTTQLEDRNRLHVELMIQTNACVSLALNPQVRGLVQREMCNGPSRPTLKSSRDPYPSLSWQVTDSDYKPQAKIIMSWHMSYRPLTLVNYGLPPPYSAQSSYVARLPRTQLPPSTLPLDWASQLVHNRPDTQ